MDEDGKLPDGLLSDAELPDSRIRIRCPDCGSDLLIDRRTGEVLFHKAPKVPPAGGKQFEDLLADLDASKSRADELFDREVTALKDRDRLLEEKFNEALERAKDAPDEEPPLRPWELD